MKTAEASKAWQKILRGPAYTALSVSAPFLGAKFLTPKVKSKDGRVEWSTRKVTQWRKLVFKMKMQRNFFKGTIVKRSSLRKARSSLTHESVWHKPSNQQNNATREKANDESTTRTRTRGKRARLQPEPVNISRRGAEATRAPPVREPEHKAVRKGVPTRRLQPAPRTGTLRPSSPAELRTRLSHAVATTPATHSAASAYRQPQPTLQQAQRHRQPLTAPTTAQRVRM